MRIVGSFSAPVICPNTIGRRSERDALSELIIRTGSRQGQVALVSGEAGIGKSRLVAEAKAKAASEDFLLLQGTCFQMDSSYPYAPLLDLLRTSVVTNPLAEDPDPIVLEFARLLPELLLSLTGILPTPLPDPEQEKRRLFAALTRFFKEQASQQPVLLVIEDLHWCDDISLEFLLSLARSCVAQPLLLLITYRNDEIQPGLQRFLAQLDRARLSQELQLVPLTRSDVDDMLGAMFDLPEGEQASLLDLIYPLTEGNPFFVEEVLTSLVPRGELVSDDSGWHYKPHPDRRSERLPVPRSVQEAVQQRTIYLSADAKRLLSLAAVAGRRFNVTLLQEVMRCDETHLLALLKPWGSRAVPTSGRRRYCVRIGGESGVSLQKMRPMRIGSVVLASALAVTLAACAPSISGINARPDKYYEHKVSFRGRIQRIQFLAHETLLEIADERGSRILVRSAAPVEAEAGDWVRVEGVLVPEARIEDVVLYDVVTAEEVERTRAPRFIDLM